jgi:hypothetical protein
VQNFGLEIIKEKDHSEDLSIDGEDTKMQGWIYLDEDRDQWPIF